MQMTAQIANHGSIAIPLRAFADRRLTGSHYRVLAAIAEHIAADATGAVFIVPQSELAAAAGVHATTAPRLIADLVEWGYVATTRSDSDRRRLSYALIHGDPANNPPRPKRRRSREITEEPAQHDVTVGTGAEVAGTDTAMPDGPAADAALPADVVPAQPDDDGNGIGTELPTDWVLTFDRRTLGEEARAARGLPWIEVGTEFDRFKQRFAGTGTRRPDWDLAWIEWCIAATPPAPEPKPAPNPLPTRPAAPGKGAKSGETEDSDGDYTPF
jgi:DNA-binding MarR family transcriptional regulator